MIESRLAIRYTIRLLLTLLLIIILLIVGVLFIPSVSRVAIEQASAYYLGHRLDIHAYHFNPARIILDGTFDDGSTIHINARHLLDSSRVIDADINTTAPFLNHLLEADLPPIDINALFKLRGRHVAVNAYSLEGKLHADMDMQTQKFSYRVEKISVSTLLKDLALPRYASGELFAEGNGTAGSLVDVSLNLKSYNINLKEPLLSLSGFKSLSSSLDLNLTSNARLTESQALTFDVMIDSAPFSIAVEDANYDLRSGVYSLLARFNNHGISEIPIRKGNILGFGRYDNTILGHYIIDADAYRINLTHFALNPTPLSAKSDFALMSNDTTVIDISGKNALSGKIAYMHDRLSCDVGTGAMPEPLHIAYDKGLVTLISNNIPIDVIAAILKHPNAADGHMRLDAAIDTSSPLLAITADLDTDDLVLTSPLFRESNLSAPIKLALNISNRSAEYEAKLSLLSNAVGNGGVRFIYDKHANKGRVDGSMQNVALPWYRTPEVNLTAAFDLDRQEASDVSFVSTYDRFHIPMLQYGDHLDTAFEYSISALNRFIPDANASAALEGNGTIKQTGSRYDVSVETQGIGTVYATLDNESQTVSAENIQLEKVFQTLGQPAPLRGEMTLAGQLDAAHGILTISAPQLTPVAALKDVLRPFPLDVTLTLSRCNQRFFGDVIAKTAYDTLTLSSIDINLFRQSFGADYQLELHDVNQSLLRIPAAYPGKQLSLRGDFSLTPERRQLSCRSPNVLLPEKLHIALDKNATGPLPMTLELNASNTPGEATLTAHIASKALTLTSLKVRYDRLASMATLESLVKTKAYPDPIALNFHAITETNGSMHDGELHLDTKQIDLNMTDMYIDPAEKNYKAELTLSVYPPKQTSSSVPAAVISGTVQTQPALEARINTDSFDGNLTAIVNTSLLMLSASDLNVSKIIRLYPSAPKVTRGTLDAQAIIDMPAFLENNLSKLSGGVDVRIRDMHIEGIEFDSYLATLKETQDLSLFQGSIGDLPIIRTVKNLPSDLTSKKAVETSIEDARMSIALSKGMAVCEDCALATNKHRIAFAGDINLTSRQFHQFYFALLNPEGCPYFMQRIRGPLLHPELNLAASGVKVIGGAVVSLASNVTDAASWLTGAFYKLTSATGDVISYVPIAGTVADKTLTTVAGTLDSTAKTVSGCTPFYTGSVQPPTAK